MSDLLPCPFCGGTNIGLLRHFSYYPHGVMCRHCYASATNVERWNTRALPAARADAAAIRETALREAADVPGSWARTWKRKAERTEGLESDGWAEDAQTCFDLEAEILALIDNPRKDAALCEMARLGQEFDAAIFSDVESLYENGEPRKEVVQPERQSNNPSIRESDTAPAGLSAGGGAGWQPIETAPRDGSRFLGYWSSSGRDGDFAVTTWRGPFDWESPFESADYDADYGPTGWMPHPPATKGE